MLTQVEDPNIIYRVDPGRPHGPSREGFFHLDPSFEEGPVVGTSLDEGVSDARHLGGDGGKRLAPEILIVAILGDMALELVAEAVIPLADCDLSGHPKRSTQAGIAELR